MVENVIAIFSSDARPLYKKDIFRVLALPKDYVIHFRYQTKYLSDDFNHISELKDKRAIVFFTIGNDLELAEEARNITNIAIREARIVDAIQEENTGMYHLFLKLLDFVNASIPIGQTNMPPSKYVSKIKVTNLQKDIWINRVNEVKHKYQNTMLFLVDGIYEGEKRLELNYSNEFKNSYYQLFDDKQYLLKISFFDPSQGRNSISVHEENHLVYFNMAGKFSIETKLDDRIYRLATKNLESDKASTTLTFLSTGEENQSTFDVGISLNIKRKRWKTLIFGICSSAILLGVVLGNYSFKGSSPKYYLAIIALVLVGVGPAILFKTLNKK